MKREEVSSAFWVPSRAYKSTVK